MHLFPVYQFEGISGLGLGRRPRLWSLSVELMTSMWTWVQMGQTADGWTGSVLEDWSPGLQQRPGPRWTQTFRDQDVLR